MFEYLDATAGHANICAYPSGSNLSAAVQRQIEYGNQRGVPWGISESGYSLVDAHLNYQYRSFGVPGLGLQRGLADDLVIAPYATALALMVAPEAALENLQKLASKVSWANSVFMKQSTIRRHVYPRSNACCCPIIHGSPSSHDLSFLSLSFAGQAACKSCLRAIHPSKSTMLLLQERMPTATAFHWQSSNISARA